MADESLAGLVRRLSPSSLGSGRLPEMPRRGALPASSVEAVPTGGQATDSGNVGLVFDLFEQVGTRQYHPARNIVSTNGLFTIVIQQPAQIALEDGNGEAGVLFLQDEA